MNIKLLALLLTITAPLWFFPVVFYWVATDTVKSIYKLIYEMLVTLEKSND
jgi:hypothetical protein